MFASSVNKSFRLHLLFSYHIASMPWSGIPDVKIFRLANNYQLSAFKFQISILRSHLSIHRFLSRYIHPFTHLSIVIYIHSLIHPYSYNHPSIYTSIRRLSDVFIHPSIAIFMYNLKKAEVSTEEWFTSWLEISYD